MRRLTREIVDFLFAGDPDSDARGLPIAWLLGSCGACLPLVDEEIAVSIATMIASGDPETHVNGLRLAMSLDVPLRGNWDKYGPDLSQENQVRMFWDKRTQENLDFYKEEIVAASSIDQGIRTLALIWTILSVEDTLKTEDNILQLLQPQKVGIFGLTYEAYLPRQVTLLTGYWPTLATENISRCIRSLASVGSYLTRHPDPPWAAQQTGGLSVRITEESGIRHNRPPAITPIAYAGLAAIALMCAESMPATISSLDIAEFSQHDPFGNLYNYIRKRYFKRKLLLPDLPVPNEFKQVFQDWAERKVNFVADPPDPE